MSFAFNSQRLSIDSAKQRADRVVGPYHRLVIVQPSPAFKFPTFPCPRTNCPLSKVTGRYYLPLRRMSEESCHTSRKTCQIRNVPKCHNDFVPSNGPTESSAPTLSLLTNFSLSPVYCLLSTDQLSPSP